MLGFYRRALVIAALLLCCVSSYGASDHPRLVLTAKDVALLRSPAAQTPAMKKSIALAKASVDKAIAKGVIVPIPKDAAGGFTHEQHKRNYLAMRSAGILYQITKQKKYANYVRDMLIAYAKMYPTLPLHPMRKKGQSPGKLFWQSLNEEVWLVYVSQAYDLVYNYLSATERKNIETHLLFPVADFLSKGQPKVFDKIHNHGTWAVAGVGMTGYVTDRKDYVQEALKGLHLDGNGGFYRQLDDLFSPDGYYTEGPYYQRYALLPFVWFAQAIANNDPSQKIFSYRDGIIKKAAYTAIELSYNGFFFPINDSLKDKGLDTDELIHAVAVLFGVTHDDRLVNIVMQQQRVSLSGPGVELSQRISQGDIPPYDFSSHNFRDGAKGHKGALSVLRTGSSDNGAAIVAKNTSQGMGHGHFDKLSWQCYFKGKEVVTDYGAARFLNVEAKSGGRYLPENTTWAKQSVAHNTLVVDETSDFNGNLHKAEQYAPEILHYSTAKKIDLVSARINNAYPGVSMTRTLALVKLGTIDPFAVDIMKVVSSDKHQYDLPLHFNGQIIDHTASSFKSMKIWRPMGKANGYQHLMLRATGQLSPGDTQLTWLLGDTFYTYSFLDYDPSRSSNYQGDDSKVLFFELGADDPKFNLRREHGVIRREKGKKSVTFVSIVEPHGIYNGAREFVKNADSRVEKMKYKEVNNNGYLDITLKGLGTYQLKVSYPNNATKNKKIDLADKNYYQFTKM